MDSSKEGTPRCVVLEGKNKFSDTRNHAQQNRIQYSQDTIGMFVGPMPPREFLKTLLPVAPRRLGRLPAVNFSSVPTTRTTEGVMYGPLVEEFNKCCPGFSFYVAACDTNDKRMLRPDIGMLKGTRPPKKKTVKKSSARKVKASAIGSSKSSSDLAAFDWEHSELCCEVKATVGADAFNDKSISTIDGRLTKEGISHRGQLISYYRELAVRQHRTFVFSLFIFGSWARFLRFDHSGCIVSARFNYKKKPRPLVEFIWRYSHLDERARGWDLTRSIASRQDTRLYQEQIGLFLEGKRLAIIPSSPTPESTTSPSPAPESATPLSPAATASRPSIASTTAPGTKPAREGPRTFASSSETIEMVERIKEDVEGRSQADYPAYSVNVKYKGSEAATTLVIQRPVHASLSPFGRGTRGYLAYDKSNNAIRFLKDYWRPVVEGHQSEAEVYDVLYEKNVRHLPNVLCAEDVVDCGNIQKTYTDTLPQDAANKKWRKSCGNLRTLQHHHIVEDLLYPLASFESSKELVGIMMDTLEGMEDSKVNAGILHRDISCGNIMITLDGDGVLNDWDNSGPAVSDPHRKLAPFRTCSWQFMAVALLENTRAPHRAWHDVESLGLWSLLYIALHHLPHVWRDNQSFPMAMFDDIDSISPHPEGKIPIYEGGSKKSDFLTRRKIRHLHFPTAPPLNALLQQVCDEFRELYLASGCGDIVEDDDRYKEISAKLDNPMYMHAKFKEAYDSKDWLNKNDWVPDQYPSLTAEQQLEKLQREIMEGYRDLGDPLKVANTMPQDKKKPSRAPRAVNPDDVAGPSSRPRARTRKRAAEADPDPDTDASGAPLRRSKRLKK